MLVALVSLLFTGLVQAAISPPWNLVVLHPLAWVPALAVFSRLRGRRAMAAGWLVGTSANLTIFCWLPGTIARFGDLPWAVALLAWLLFALATGFYAALFAWGFARIRRAGGALWPFAAAAWFCALEFLNPQLFGYLQGVAWYQLPHVFLVSAYAGVSAVSFVVIAANAVALQGMEAAGVLARGRQDAQGQGAAVAVAPPRASSWRSFGFNAAVLSGLVLLAFACSSVRLREIDAAEQSAPSMRLALVQPNMTIALRDAMSRGRPDAFAEDLLALSREAAARSEAGGAGFPARKVDAYVWPEGALRADPSQARNRSVLVFVTETGSEVWTGANHYQADRKLDVTSHNSAFRVFGRGEIDRRYDKNILVPFGEYVPLKGVVPGFDRIPSVGNFEAGRDIPSYASGPARFVFLVCYEAIRPSFVRRALAGDVNLMVNVTADAWYGDSSEQTQHLMLAAIQSALAGVPLVRSTTTGISAFVDARGVITAKTGTFTREALVADVKPLRVDSVVTRLGDWFAWLCVAASAALLAASRRAGAAD